MYCQYKCGANNNRQIKPAPYACGLVRSFRLEMKAKKITSMPWYLLYSIQAMQIRSIKVLTKCMRSIKRGNNQKNKAVKNNKGISGAAMMPPICATAIEA